MINKILRIILEKNILTQREIAEYLDISLGSVNNYLNKCLQEELIIKKVKSYREREYILTTKGLEKISMNKKINLAVILLAGQIKNIKESIGEIKLGKEPMIERHIKLLKKMNIENIVIVVGNKTLFYLDLQNKYDFLKIIENRSYFKTGNMFSLYLTRNLIQEDFILIDGDLVYTEELIIDLVNSKYKNVTIIDKKIIGAKDILYADISNSKLLNLSKNKTSLQNIAGQLIGISKIKYENFLNMCNKFIKIKNTMYFYEYFFCDSEVFKEFYTIEKNNIIWGEIDNKNQYNYLIKNILPKLKEE